ncbi:Lrp/AsnC family transcriptional regulator [Dongia rigui]|uniref:Lrp/AsnC family transcriptional regulator n=1 Tax=Dongia rigui TaxID=940149 RepID=A0ABU5E2Q4_9PROT|nr:Lrp/AsnC family transcriptional regulator [Dongia rigui]MDY0873470.1 Lrp/AsnC family transcriptional regulator [Dongia rigui]
MIAVLDEIDRNIVAMMQVDATLAYADLGERVGLSASTINDRLKRLRAKGVIRRVSAEIDPHALGLDLMVIVLVEVTGRAEELAFITAMQAVPAVMECHHVAGEFSYLLKVRVASTAAYEHFLDRHLKTLAGIRRTQSLIALSSAKDSRVLPSQAPAEMG